jgi:hypothetical protein
MNGEELERLSMAAGQAHVRGDYKTASELWAIVLEVIRSRPNHSVWTRDEERAERDR